MSPTTCGNKSRMLSSHSQAARGLPVGNLAHLVRQNLVQRTRGTAVFMQEILLLLPGHVPSLVFNGSFDGLDGCRAELLVDPIAGKIQRRTVRPGE